jgi:hypothetical protein
MQEARMRYLKSVLAGIMAALVVAAIAIPSCFWLTGYRLERNVMSRFDPSQGGVQIEADFVDVNLLPIFCLGLAAFVAGFFWKPRRGSRPAS